MLSQNKDSTDQKEANGNEESKSISTINKRESNAMASDKNASFNQ